MIVFDLWNLDKYKNKDARENALGSIIKEVEIAGLKNLIKAFSTEVENRNSVNWIWIKSVSIETCK